MPKAKQKQWSHMTPAEFVAVFLLVVLLILLLLPALQQPHRHNPHERTTNLLIDCWLDAAEIAGQKTGRTLESVDQVRETFIETYDDPHFYETSIKFDGWGRPFRLDVHETKDGTQFEIQTSGKNGVFDDADDRAMYVIIGRDGKATDRGLQYP